MANLTNSKIWSLRGVEIQAIVSDQTSQTAASRNQPSQPLFNNSTIPTSYLRSCLLSPKFFPVINKVLTQILSKDDSDYHLRSYILKFLNKIMKVDKDFIPLIMNEINIEHFL